MSYIKDKGLKFPEIHSFIKKLILFSLNENPAKKSLFNSMIPSIFSEGNILVKDGRRSKTMLSEEMRNQGHVYIEIFERHHRQLLLIKGVEVTW